MRVIRSLVVLALLALPLSAQEAPPPDIDDHVQSVMLEFEVPGIALAIVKDGAVVLARGYGVRRLGERTPVDEFTLFGIASNTKAFTATALGLLVEAGKLEWDAPVVDYLPWFQMYDPWVTRQLTIRDLLVHRSGLGLGAGDLLWWPPSDYARREIARRLRFIEPATSFRSAYAYDNVLYTVAGEVIEEVTGQTWEEFVEERIVGPVGMTHSTVRYSTLLSSQNVASPHARIEGTVRPVTPFTSDNVTPAGGINSGAADMAKWMIVQLDSGRLADGSRLFQPRTTWQLWRPVTPIPFGPPPPVLAPLERNSLGYGLGFNISDFRGEKLVAHTGGLPGYVSRVALVPGHRLGVAVLTNMESGAAFNAIAWHVVDHYLDAPEFDWLGAYVTRMAWIDSVLAARDQQTAASRDASSAPSLPLERYAGTYTDAWYGDVVIVYEDGKLEMRFSHTPSLVGEMEHWQYDTFVARWYDRELRADAFVTFALGPSGNIEQATMRAFSSTTDFSFDFHDLLLKPARRH
jgi:CubicO group peptidase (beta-lactamase class C family)